MAKRICSAWIEQIVEFDTKLEYLAYIEEQKKSGRKFSEVQVEQSKDGVVKLRIRKQYNNNRFPDAEGGEGSAK